MNQILMIFVPLVVWQVSVVFEPGHGGNQGWVVFDFALKLSGHSFLHHPVLWLLQDTSRL